MFSGTQGLILVVQSGIMPGGLGKAIRDAGN